MDAYRRGRDLTDEQRKKVLLDNARKRQLLGSQLLDNIQGKIGEAGSAIMEASQDDPDTWTDDIIRIGLGGVKNVGTVLGAPGIKQGLQLVGAPAYYVGRGLGYGLEKTGVDPRYGYLAGEVGEWFIPGYGAYKAAGKITKYSKIVGSAALSDAAALMAKQNPMIASGAGAVPSGGELRKIANQILWDIQHPVSHLPKLGRSTPEKRYRQIFNNTNKYKYPSIEELDLATRGPGLEIGNWKYDRLQYSPTPDKKWKSLANDLQKRLGGTDEQKESFILLQKATWKQTNQDIKQLNKRFQFNYLEFAATALDEDLAKGVTDITAVDDLVYKLYLEMASNPNKYPIFELGHIKSAKNVAREATGPTSADYASNLRAEIKRSIRDFKDDGRLVEAGNQLRKAHEDAPDVVNLLLGTSPNLDVEYIRHIGDFGYALENIIPFERQDHFMEYLRKGIKRWQTSEPGGLSGPYQLRFYRRQLHKLIDDYLNDLRDGKFPEQLGKSDFEADSAIRAGIGQTKLDEIEASGRAAIRGEKGTIFDEKGFLEK
jgi:hypothetical protein